MERKKTGGVFSCQELKKAISDGVIKGRVPVDEGQIQPASIDLRLGAKAYRLVSSFLPENQDVVEKLHRPDVYGSDLVMYEMDIGGDGGILEKGSVYLIPLLEELDLPKTAGGKANPKSTTGRLDIFTRVITDRNPRFDEIPPGYGGGLFLEVMPRSFTVKVREGLSLVQLRLRNGEPSIGDAGLKRLNKEVRLLYDGKEPLSNERVRIANGIFMSVDLKGDGPMGIIGYKSKRNSHVIDLTKRNYYNIEDFWEPIYRNNKGTLILEPEEFYILASKEKIRIPSACAAEMLPYEAGSGELRTHYAGFFDPGFGYGKDGEVKGTKAVLEVRAHDVPFMISHGQTFCKLFFEKMREVPEKVYGPRIGSSYQYQTITLSKQFKNG
ncbi:MAG: 2'-deoxycytidine 5'-triphosphate deaminase [Deltaproteobacteria bacterium]|nr:2'-deoxycytidine 5'-triphosphate deaminase [Deltaproteobacteria bacterium]